MARPTVNKERRRAIRDAKKVIQDLARMDGNEAETRRRVERVFESVMGYDALKHLSRERAVKASGLTEHIDFTVQLEEGPEADVQIIVELKRVGLDLAPKHLKQATSYAINYGCEWVLLTNGREWRLYHVEFGQPPKTRLIEQWDLLADDASVLETKFDLVSYRNVRKGGLKVLWQHARVLRPASVLAAIVSEDSLRLLRKTFKKTEGVTVPYEDIVSAIAKLLNEASAKELEGINPEIPQRKKRGRKPGAKPQVPTSLLTKDVVVREESASADGDG